MKLPAVAGCRTDETRLGNPAPDREAAGVRVRRLAGGGDRRMKLKRTLFTAVGLLWAGLGVIGAFVPLMPSTIFLILAAWCFARGNARLYRRLRRHPLYAPVRDWQAGRGLSVATKVAAVGSITLTFSLSTVFVLESPVLRAALTSLALGLSVYILRQPTRSYP